MSDEYMESAFELVPWHVDSSAAVISADGRAATFPHGPLLANDETFALDLCFDLNSGQLLGGSLRRTLDVAAHRPRPRLQPGAQE